MSESTLFLLNFIDKYFVYIIGALIGIFAERAICKMRKKRNKKDGMRQ